MVRRFIIFILFVISISFVSASFAVSSPYNGGNSLSLEPGSIKEIEIKLSNPSYEMSKVEVSFLDDGGIAKFVGDTVFELGAGDIVSVPIEIKIPENAENSYEIKILSDSLAGEGEGTVSFSPSYITSFFVLTGETIVADNGPPNGAETTKEDKDIGSFFFSIVYLILSFMIIATLIVIAVYMRRKKINGEYDRLVARPMVERNV